jgi:2-polyprenyl-3-methyl-5-hydroxy-6-metoxy-1,4-benzoquinol methylase
MPSDKTEGMEGMIRVDTEGYGWTEEQSEGSHGYLLPEVLRLIERGPRGRLIDIGAGNGVLLKYWGRAGWDVSAMEPDSRGFHFARSKAPAADVRQLAVGDGLPPDWKGRFDVAVCLEVVEHLYDPRQLPSAASQLLRNGGMIVVSTPYHGYLKNLAIALLGKWDFHHDPLWTGGHIKFWSRPKLERLFNEHGFRRVSFKGVGRIPWLWKSMVMAFVKETP